MKFSISICMSAAIAIVMPIVMATLSASNLNAQDSDRDDRDHERRIRDAYRREQWRKDFNAAEYIKSQDKNKDGVLDPEEIDGRRTKRFLEQLGIPTGKTSKVDDLIKGYKSRISKETAKKRKEFESRLMTLAEFGTETESFGVDGFGTDDKTEGLQSFDETASGMKASDFDSEMLKKADKILGTFDRDDNGFLDGDEISRLSWKSPPPETSDLNRDGRLSKMELAKRFTMDQETTQKSRSSREPDDSRSRGSSSEGLSRGEYWSRRGDDGRDRGSRSSNLDSRRHERRKASKPLSSSAVAKAKANAKSSAGYAKYVDRSFKNYDANSDGKLDKKELSASSLLKKARDSDGDGLISKQEAIAFVSGGKNQASVAATGGPDPQPTPRAALHGGATAAAKSKSKGKSKSKSKATASTGRRSSLSNKDVDEDGQIQMHEYTDTWTAAKLKEFRDKDKNEDGILSPAEWSGRKH